METVSGGDSVTLVVDSIDYSEQFAQIIERTNEVNEFLYALVNRIDFLIAFLVALLVCAIAYFIIKAFTRF